MENNNMGYVEQKTNGMCVAGFVVSLVSIVLCGAISWISLILSIIGVAQVGKGNGKGKGLGVAGIVISSIMLLVGIIGCLVIIFTTGLSALMLGQEMAEYAEAVESHNAEIQAELDEEEDTDVKYDKIFGSYEVRYDWNEIDQGEGYYVYCLEGTHPDGDIIPNNIMVSHDSNPYGVDESMDFKDAIMAQLAAQTTDEVEEITGGGLTTANGDAVLKFDIVGEDVEKIQYYIVGDHQYVCVSAMLWDMDAAESDGIVDVAEGIVNSFEWVE